MQHQSSLTNVQTDENINEWFERNMVHWNLEKIRHQTKTLTPEREAMYNELAQGEVKTLMAATQKTINDYYRKKITLDFFEQISETGVNLKRLGLGFSLSSVLVWAEIEENDEQSEDELILIKARINAAFQSFGYKISCTIVEDCDQLPIPPGYKEVHSTE